MKKGLIWTGFFLIILVAGFFVFNDYIYKEKNNLDLDDVLAVTTEDEVFDFVKKGVVVFDNPGMPVGVPVLVYEEPGSPGLFREIVFDDYSICETSIEIESCVDLGDRFLEIFGGKKVLVEGQVEDEKIKTRRLSLIVEE